MSDIFQEVDQDIRRERMKALWDRYGIIVLVAAVVIVVGTAGWSLYEAWNTGRERAAGDQFATALANAEDGESAASAQRLIALSGEVPGGYAFLARFRAATEFHQAGDTARAASLFTELASDSAVPGLYQDLATVRLAQVHLDAGDHTAARTAAAALADEAGNAFTHAAQEIMGFAAYAENDRAAAERWFSGLEEGAGVPPDLQQRAGVMTALLDQTRSAGEAGSGAAAADTETAPGAGDEAAAAVAGETN